jgi:hypothetical protein
MIVAKEEEIMLLKRGAQIVVLIFVGVVVLSGWMTAAQRNERTTWTYKVVQYTANAKPVEDVQSLLSEQGALGWELVGAEEKTREPDTTYFYFKKSR